MRIVFDLQCCQTKASRGRGVGRYSQSLTRQIAIESADDIRICVNGGLADGARELIDAFEGVLPASRFSAYRPSPLHAQERDQRDAGVALTECFIRHHWLSLQPDVLHLAHVFEGLGDEGLVPRTLPSVPGVVRSATLYDLIPLRFPHHYLERPDVRRWYYEKLGTIRQCDHLLAISESTRRDAIELLGLEPARITTIHGGAEAMFAPRSMSDEGVAAFRRRWALKRRFVLYTGGDDFRKNLPGALDAYAGLPAAMRTDMQLVFVCAISAKTRADLLARGRKRGLAADEVVCTGFVSDDDLISFYNLCDVFVFPSLYEGFGLPVLEAMQCGAPALGASNSSIGEIIGRQDALFDAGSVSSMTERLAWVLADPSARAALRRHGVERAKEFSWERSARLALNALESAHAAATPAITVAAGPQMPRRRLAMFSPLPPCRSGVADYNAALLPYLGRHFDIDLYVDDYEVGDPYLRANFVVRSHRQFDLHAAQYDAVVYEMGNSEFHAYMLGHLERHPGIVVLHDAFLSGLYGYLDFNEGDSGRFMREMMHSHGSRARRYFAPAQGVADPVGGAMLALPATRSVLEMATGVVSHSPFNRDVAATNYPEGWTAPYRIVNQMARVKPVPSESERAALRTEIGVGANDFLVCTFGHVVWTKCGDVLLEAFRRSALGQVPHVRLLYVGELAKDDFGHALKRSIAASGIADRVSITGFLSEAGYNRYLAVADMAVQLRTHSRGGTPKGVLDCLAHGIPVVLNNAASYEDYPNDVVVKLPAEPSANALIALFDGVHRDPAALRETGRRGREYVEREHSGERVAARFAQIVEELRSRHAAVALPAVIGDIGRILAPVRNADALAAHAAKELHANIVAGQLAPRRVLVDVSHIAAGDHATGIQRVVRNVVRWMYCSARAGFRAIAVRLENGQMREASGWLDTQGLRTAVERAAGSDAVVEAQWGDCLLMLDSSWERYSEFVPIFDRVRALNGRVDTVVYDLLPLRLAHCWPPGASAWFRSWVETAIAQSDTLLCISRSVADELAGLMLEGGLPRGRVRRIGYWRLGHEAAERAGDGVAISESVRTAMAGPRTLLMVGTIEPRKNHALVLDAVELLWARGADVSLCIVGKQGWLVEELIERLRTHRERGKRLHHLDRISDPDLHHCYRNAECLLFPSAGEGFGLPLVEAAHFGTPILASDLPVLREVADDCATYFELGSAASLADAIESWRLERDAGRAPDSSGIEAQTWEQSTEMLLDTVLEGRWYRTLPPQDGTL